MRASDLRNDHGAGSVLVVGVMAAIMLLLLLCVPLLGALAGTRAAASAAEAAALAAADTAVGIIPGVPCEAAARTAEANGARLTECVLDGYVATVSVSRGVRIATVMARATAGPPMTIVKG